MREKSNVSDVKQGVGSSRIRLLTAGVRRMEGVYGWRQTTGVKIQLLRRSSVAVSTSQDFDDNATITAFFSKPMAQSLSILRVYSGLETGAPA